MDPSVVGRWERTPVVLPILDQIDVIDEPTGTIEGLSQVQPEDLVPVVHEYVMGPGDVLAVTIFELMQPNQESVLFRRVDDLGMIRLPVIGAVQAAGVTPSELERRIVQILGDRNILKDATVSLTVQEGRQNTFSVIGEPRLSGTAIGTYVIPKNDFRLLDAMALARGVSGSIKTIFVIRQVPLSGSDEDRPAAPDRQPGSPPSGPADLIDDLLGGVGDDFQSPGAGSSDDDLPEALDQSMDRLLDQPSQWVHVNGQWVRVGRQAAGARVRRTAAAAATPQQAKEEGLLSRLVTQRVVEIPYDKLLDGDMRYNIVVRPGDIIRVPPPVIGNVYIGGAISRPGTYSLPGDKDLTLKQLVFAAGNLSPLAIPERVDLIRRVGKAQEATVRLDLRAIFEGTQPDFYLKPNDTINVGTSFAALPLLVVRNGFRVSYGFGFVLDRNFSTDVFGPIDTN